jgi:hypothetical protein
MEPVDTYIPLQPCCPIVNHVSEPTEDYAFDMPNSKAESLPTVVLLSVKLDRTVGFEDDGEESEEESMSIEESFESSSRLSDSWRTVG